MFISLIYVSYFFLLCLLDNMSASKVVRASIDLHSNIMKLVDGEVILFENKPNDILTEEQVFIQAVTLLMCASYRNQMVNTYVRPALVVLACKMASSSSRGRGYYFFSLVTINCYPKEEILEIALAGYLHSSQNNLHVVG